MNSLTPKEITRARIENLLWPFGLFSLALFLRLGLIGKGYYHADCFYLGIQAQKILDTGQMHYLHLVGYPLTGLLGALFLALGHFLRIENPALSINLMSVLFSSLSLVPLYFVVKKLFDALTAILSVVLVMVHPIFLAVSVFGNSHMPSLFFYLLSLYGILRFRETNSFFYLGTSTLSAGLMISARPQEVILFFPLSCLFFGGILPSFRRQSLVRKITSYCLFLSISMLILGLFYIPSLKDMLSGGQTETQLSRYLSISRFYLNKLAPHALRMSTRALLRSFTWPGALLVLAGLFLICKKNLKIFLFLLFWAAPGLLTYGSLIWTMPRYHLNVIIPLSIALCFCLVKMIQRSRLSLVIACIIYGMLVGALFSEIYPILNFRHKHDLMKEFGQWVKANTEPNAIIFDQDECRIIEHFSGRATKNPPFPEFASDTYSPQADRVLADTKAFLEQKLKEGIPIYTTSIGINSYDPEFRFKNLLERFFRLKYVTQTTKEEWHQGSTNLILYREILYKIEMK